MSEIQLSKEMISAGFRLYSSDPGMGAYADLGILSIDVQSVALTTHSDGSSNEIAWRVYLGDSRKVVRVEHNFRSRADAMDVALELAKAINRSNELIAAQKARGEEDTPEHRLDNYQHFLGRIADAAGVTGSPTLEEVLERIRKMALGLRNCSEAGVDGRILR